MSSLLRTPVKTLMFEAAGTAREALEYAGVNMSDIEQAFDIFDSTDDDYADFGVRGSLIYTVTMDSEDYNRYYYE